MSGKWNDPKYVSEWKRNWRINNRERLLLKSRSRYQENRESIISKAKEYARTNKESVAEYHRNYYQKNKASFQAKSKEYSKIHSNDVKARCKKWYRDNKDRHRTYSEQYKKDNTDRVKEWSRLSSERQRKKHPDNQKRSYKKWYLKVRNTQSFKAKRGAIFMKYRALKKGASVNLKSIKSFMVRVKRNPTFVCYHCQHTFPISALHFDHIIPLSRGGSHSIGNLCTSCRPCNCSKNNTLLSEWSRLGQQLLPI